MKPLTLEWVAKAEGDFCVMEREGRVRRNPSFDSVCFHAQQCAEKYLKARLCEGDIRTPRTHDLVSLLELALPVEPAWETAREDLAFLSEFAVSFRYPGELATKEQAADAKRRARAFRKLARTSPALS